MMQALLSLAAGAASGPRPAPEVTPAVDLTVLITDVALLTFLAMILIAIIRSRSLFIIVMLAGLYSLICATWFVLMDAVDVAFTEAAVGAGISTVLLLGAMLLTARTERKPKPGSTWVPLVVVVLTGLLLAYAAIDLPAVGDAYSPANIYVGLQYMERLAAEIDIPNAVTATLASYRGFDTWGEACVIFAAGTAVVMLLGFGERALLDRSAPYEPEAAGDMLAPSSDTREQP